VLLFEKRERSEHGPKTTRCAQHAAKANTALFDGYCFF
jgi:hypothetical protein